MGKYIAFIAVSLALHLLIFFGFIWTQDFRFMNELSKRLDHKIIDKSKDLSTQIELIDLKFKQVVEQAKTTKEQEEPKDSKYLSASNKVVKKETKAQRSGAFRNSTPLPFMMSKPQRASKKITAKKLLAQKVSSKIHKSPLGLKGLPLSQDPNEILNRKLSQNKQIQVKNIGPSQSDDYLKGVKVGDQTLLNTKKFRFYSFYSRIKGRLRSHWTPLIRQQVSFYHSTGRSISSLDKKKTSLRITLNKNGYLEKIELLHASGDKSLDTAAIQAFREAAPFPNPPKGLLGKDKKILLFWDFVLEG